MKAKLIEKMAQLALQHPQMDVSDIYNALMQSIPDADVDFVSQHYAMMLTVARSARAAPKDVQEFLLKNA
jgi:hypothetical protein